MARKDLLSEEIKLLTEMLKLLWLTLIALIGSTGGLILAEVGFRKIAIVMGSLAIMAVAGLVGYLYRRIYSQVQRMEDV